MTGIDRDALKAAVHEALDERRGVEEVAHRLEHEFIRRLMAREDRRALFLDGLLLSVTRWGLLGVLGFLLLAAGHYLKMLVKGG